MKQIRFNRIIIIQSLKSGRSTGDEILVQIKHACAKAKVEENGILVNINTRAEFFQILQEIESSISLGMMPYLHIEMHGHEEGLVLSNGELIFWNELKEPIRKINIKSGNNLFISMATCYGANLLDLYHGEFDKPCPFFGYVGPETEVEEKDVEITYTAYFHELIVSADIPTALVALQNSVPKNNEIYTYINCEVYRALLIKRLKDDNDLAYKIKRKKSLIERAKKMGTGKTNKEIEKDFNRIVFSDQEEKTLKEFEDIFLHRRPPVSVLSKYL